MLLVRAYPRETQEPPASLTPAIAWTDRPRPMVFDAHDRAFAFFQGARPRGIDDNMKPALAAILVGKERLYNRRFLQMCSHFLVDPVACTPASGPRRALACAPAETDRRRCRRWEKGQVENHHRRQANDPSAEQRASADARGVGLVRERFFAPRIRVKSYDELNAWLPDQAIAYAKAPRHPEFKDQTVWQVFEAERASLVPYPGRFDGFHAVPASVSKTCLVRFDNNRYSVAASAVGRPAEIRAYRALPDPPAGCQRS
jgi:hypothetical protein